MKTLTRQPPKGVYMRVRDHQHLADMCEMRGITRRDLAAACGWASPSYPHRILTGKVRTITPRAAVHIAAYLEVPMDLLFLPAGAGVTMHERAKVAA